MLLGTRSGRYSNEGTILCRRAPNLAAVVGLQAAYSVHLPS